MLNFKTSTEAANSERKEGWLAFLFPFLSPKFCRIGKNLPSFFHLLKTMYHFPLLVFQKEFITGHIYASFFLQGSKTQMEVFDVIRFRIPSLSHQQVNRENQRRGELVGFPGALLCQKPSETLRPKPKPYSKWDGFLLDHSTRGSFCPWQRPRTPSASCAWRPRWTPLGRRSSPGGRTANTCWRPTRALPRCGLAA